MAIVHKTDKKTGTVYVYESVSRWIPELKQPRATTRLIGKLDPTTGKVIPTLGRGRPKKSSPDSPTDDSAPNAVLARKEQELLSAKQRIIELELALKELRSENARMKDAIETISGTLNKLFAPGEHE